MIRTVAIAALALCVGSATPGTLAAQSRGGVPPMLGTRAAVTLGVQQLQLDEINDQLQQWGYERFGGNFYRLGYSHYRIRDALLFGLEVDFMFPTELRSARGDVGNAHTYASTGMLNAGYAVRASPETMIYPFAGVGGGMLGLHVSSRGPASFNELVQNPGRTTTMSEGSLLFNVGAGIDQLVVLRRTATADLGLVVGARLLYTAPVATTSWRYARTPFAAPRVEGGPPTGIRGLAVALSIGAAPRPSPSR